MSLARTVVAAGLSLALIIAPASEGRGGGDAAPDRAPNRLVHETSPYLLQHAYNPVDWWPWGPAAFEAARAQNKPIFLSIGYSTCYWCHVMERESFENDAIAQQMNENFICIKVDREERPDVDNLYITAVQVMKGRGGWPLSVFIDPETLRPFRGGTYFPNVPKRGRPSFPQLMTEVKRQWVTDRDGVRTEAARIAKTVERRLDQRVTATPVGSAQVEMAIVALMNGHDPEHGGFRRGAPKFPIPVNLELLMEVGWDRPEVQRALRRTLDAMAMGGIYDQVGGGFHRYSTDARWLVPHFEKMLYDNGQLASIYARAYERTGDPLYARITRETLDYVLREMTGDRGAFFSAQDAEVNAREGGSYVWTRDEVERALAAAELTSELGFTIAVFGLDAPNFQDPHHPGDGRKNVLFRKLRPDAHAGVYGLDEEAFERRLVRVRAALLAARDLREQPGTDDKVIVAWNALMIIGLVDGARALDEPRYLAAAERAAGFIFEGMRTPDSGLYRTYREGEARIDAFLVDYALFVAALLKLDEATSDPRWREAALQLSAQARRRFWDESTGGYYNTRDEQPDLFVRSRQFRDGVIPCGNSVMIGNLVDLADRSQGTDAFGADAAATLASMSAILGRNPTSVSKAVLNLHRVHAGDPELLPGRGGTPATTPSASNPVVVTTSASAVGLRPGQPGKVDVIFDIAPGFHINAHEPGQLQLIPLELRITGGSGVRATPEFPAGDLYRGEIRIHEGRVRIPVRLDLVGQWEGEPRLMVIYQVCTDRACLPSTGKVLPVRFITKANRGSKGAPRRTGS